MGLDGERRKTYSAAVIDGCKRTYRGKGGHNRMVRHDRTPLYRPRGIISGFEIVLHCVILPHFHLVISLQDNICVSKKL